MLSYHVLSYHAHKKKHSSFSCNELVEHVVPEKPLCFRCLSCNELVDHVMPEESICFRCFVAPPVQNLTLDDRAAPGDVNFSCWYCSQSLKSDQFDCPNCNAWFCRVCSCERSGTSIFGQPSICKNHFWKFICPICEDTVLGERPCFVCKNRNVCSICSKFGNGGFLCVKASLEFKVAHQNFCAYCGKCSGKVANSEFTGVSVHCFYTEHKESRESFVLCAEDMLIFSAISDIGALYKLGPDLMTLIARFVCDK